MAGLDNIKHYKTGEEVTADDTADTAAPLAAAAAKTQTSKDKFVSSLPTATNQGAISSELLQNLQDMIKEREAQKNNFMSAMKDATAWWSGGVHGPAEALRARDLERENQEASTFGMKSQLAQYKAAQAAAANQAASLKSTLPGAGGAPGAAGAGAQMPPAVVQEINRLLSLNPPDVAAAQALRTKWASNESKFDAARHTQQTYYISPEIGNVNMDPEQAAQFKQTGILPDGRKVARPGQAAPTTSAETSPTGGVLPHTKPLEKVSAVSSDQLPPPVLGANTAAAKDAGVPVLSGYRDTTKQGELKTASLQPGYKGPPVAAPGQSLHQTDEAIDVPDYKALKPEQLKWLTDNGYRQTLPKTDPNHFAKVPGLTGAPATTVSLPQQRATLATTQEAPATSTADLPYPKPANAEEVKANQDFIKKRSEKQIDIASKGPEQASTEAGKRRSKMFELADATDNTVKAADMAIAASTSRPEATGIGKGKTAANALVTVAGALIPKMDKAKAEDIYGSFQGDEAIKAREAIVGSSKQLGIDFAANVFKGARMGIGLENMAANAKNVSEHNTAETNIINAKIIKEAALFNKARAELYNQWAPKNGGAMADFEKFETSPEYKALAKATQDKIASELPKYLKVGPNGLEQTAEAKKLEGASSTGASKFDQYRKKKTD